MENNKMNLAQKLIEIGKKMGPLEHTKKIGSGKFEYGVTEAHAIIGPVKRACEEYGVIIVPGIPNYKLDIVSLKETRTESDGFAENLERIEGYVVSGNMSFKVINVDNPEDFMETSWIMAGIDKQDPSKAVGKAITYCHKYLYRALFNLSSEEDPDSQDGRKGKKY